MCEEKEQPEFEVCHKCGALITISSAAHVTDGGYVCALCSAKE